MKRALALCLALLSAGCATRAPRPVPPPPAAAAAQESQRLAWLAARPDWSLQGRLAVNQAGKGGSGRIDWRQQGDRYEVSLSAPVTRQSWRLSGDASGARLEGLDGGPREGPDAGRLLYEATGWTIPVREMASWVRGLALGPEPPADGDGTRDAEGRPLRLDQQGWQVDYRDWHPPAADRPALPRRIEARYGTAQLRLVVDGWEFPGP